MAEDEDVKPEAYGPCTQGCGCTYYDGTEYDPSSLCKNTNTHTGNACGHKFSEHAWQE